MPQVNHPLWGIIERSFVLLALTFWFEHGYLNGIDWHKDGIALLIPLTTGGILGGARLVSSRKQESPP